MHSNHVHFVCSRGTHGLDCTWLSGDQASPKTIDAEAAPRDVHVDIGKDKDRESTAPPLGLGSSVAPLPSACFFLSMHTDVMDSCGNNEGVL